MKRFAIVAMLIMFCSTIAYAQSQSSTNPQEPLVPRLVRFNGTARDSAGRALPGVVGITFFIYRDQQGGAPLWMETQNVQPDATGRYTVTLGATKAEGIPVELFTSGEARWVGVQVQGQAEQPRVLLLSVPYALKAVDAQTLGGKPASAYALAGTPAVLAAGTSGQTTPGAFESGKSAVQPMTTTCASVTSDGTAAVNALAKFSTPCNVEGSAISESGGRVGIGGAGVTGAKLALTDTQTNFGLKWLQHSMFNTSATANGTNYASALDADASNMMISAGVTDKGYRLGVYGRGFANSTGFAGTLAQQFGVNGSAGIMAGKSGARVESAYGGYYQIYNNVPGTTITNAYGVYIANSGTTGTITNRYDLYASSANAKNYFAGNVGIGTTTPGAKLEVNGTTKFDGLVSFAPGQSFPGSGSIASVNATPGSGLTAHTTAGAVTLGTDFSVIQKRVATACPTGQFLQGIGADGTPGCAALALALPTGVSLLGSSPVAPTGLTETGWVAVNGTAPWTVGASLKTARWQNGVANIGSKIFAVGGTNETGLLSSLEQYDTSDYSPAWLTMTPSGTFTARRLVAVAASKAALSTGAMYVFGGSASSGTSSLVDMYDPVANAWTGKASLPQALFGACAATDTAGFIYILGGYGTAPSSTVYKYDPAQNVYAPVASMPTAVYYHACATYNNKIYAFGGWTGSSLVNLTQVYDIAGNSWTSGAPLPITIDGAGTAVLGSQIYLVSGYNQDTLSTLYIYDPGANTWTSAPPSPSGHRFSGAAAVNSLLYAVAGYTTSSSAETDVYNPAVVKFLYTKN